MLVARGVGEPPAASAAKPGQTDKPKPTPAGDATVAANASEAPVEHALASPAELDFDKATLQSIMATISARYKINILFDIKALNDAGVSIDDPIAVNLKGISLRSGMRLILSARDLKYVVPEGTSNTLLITSAEAAKNYLTVRVYNVRDFAQPLSHLPNRPAGEYDEIIDVVTSTIAPISWEGAGGAGSADSLAGTLVVSQTEEVHERLTNLLSMLKIAQLRQQTKLGGDTIEASGTAEAKILKALDTATDLDFDAVPLKDVVDTLKVRHGIEIQIDTKALTDAGHSPDDPVTVNLKGVSLRSALRLMLSAMDLNYYIDQQTLLITSAEVEKSKIYPNVYPVGDLIQSVSEASVVDSEGAYEQLAALITETVAPNTWTSAGGPGDLRALIAAKSVVISQTIETHDAIGRMLAKLRRGFADTKSQAGTAETHAGPETISYVYRLAYANKEFGDLPDRYVTSIKTFIDPESWSDNRFAIQSFPDRIIVRQTPATQYRVERFLLSLGAIDPPGTANLSGPALSAARLETAGGCRRQKCNKRRSRRTTPRDRKGARAGAERIGTCSHPETGPAKVGLPRAADPCESPGGLLKSPRSG